MSTLLEAKRLTVKVGSTLLVQQDGEIRAGRHDSRAPHVLSRRRHGQEVMVVTSGSIARRQLRLDEKHGAAGQIIPPQAVSSIARPEVAKRDSIVCLDQCHALDAGHVRDLTTALGSASGRSIHVISGVARSVIERTLREAAAGAFTA